MSAFPIPRITPEEYFALDDASEQRLEYHDGEVFPIADVTFAHSVLQANLLRAIGNRLDGTPCRAISTMRVRVSPTKYVQPDLIVFCGKPELNKPPDNSLTNPKVICEVLSPSTADYDSGGKFRLYRLLPSFEEYVVVAQDQPRVEVFRRTPEGKWLLSTFEGEHAIAEIGSLSIEIPLSEIYDRALAP